jgi:hypothetical protein
MSADRYSPNCPECHFESVGTRTLPDGMPVALCELHAPTKRRLRLTRREWVWVACAVAAALLVSYFTIGSTRI